jgi:hypothetical protein
MSHTPHDKSNELVHSEGPKHSEPQLGHEGTSYEAVDAKTGLVVYSLAIIGLTLVVVFAMTVAIQKYIQARNPIGELPSPLAADRVVPPAPQLQVQPWNDLPEMRSHEDQVLNSSGIDANGRTHTPITEAISTIVSRLKIQPNAPVGLTAPGGGGRIFAGSLADLPPQLRAPSIQGEIQKHAK